MSSSPIFETRRQDRWAAFTGVETDDNKEWLEAFQSALDNIPRLAVAGSDAHSFTNYGKFPSGKATWIKADPTFFGLQQVIKEPAKRSFIGERPVKLNTVNENKTYFIDSIEVAKNAGSPIVDDWLSNCNLPLNPDLVAIIGNKGSGKSALADIIALLGNSQQKAHFSFLSSKRFCQKPKVLAQYFTGKIKWCDQSSSQCVLSVDPTAETVELVRYIPQAHFEKLCNAHASGESDIFENELRKVIFDHTSPSIRQKALDFDQLIEQQESSYRDSLGEYRKDLNKLNQEIDGIESQLQPEKKRSLEDLFTLKKKQIEEHKKIKPKAEPKPSEQLTLEQQQASAELEKISTLLKVLNEKLQTSKDKEAQLAAKAKAIQTVRDRLSLLKRQFKQFQDETAEELNTIGLGVSDVATLTTKENTLLHLASLIPQEQKAFEDEISKYVQEQQNQLTKQKGLKAKLTEPQQRYEHSLMDRKVWFDKLRDLTGTSDAPETLKGIRARIDQLDQLPALLIKKEAERLTLSSDIYDILDAQRKAREELFKPVQEVIQGNRLIRDEYKLQFQANLGGTSDSLASDLFELIKRNSGEFRGEDESYAAVRKLAEQYDLNNKQDALKYVSELHAKILAASATNRSGAFGIASLLKVNKNSSDVYDLLFGLSFLKPRYTLLFQDTQIEQLSPGQRGALLLIFYLLVDKGRNPIILDQPEENLDNETVVSLLVPVLSEAKKRRQIIMVTHNPNLAVVCDAEQVIYSSFDRKNASKIKYVSGAIENPVINKHVVNVLEGTKPAFNNRRIKYH